MKRKSRKKAINPEFYIGYADDNESIEDIMQKFTYLDQIQAKNKENESLTNEQIQDLYKKTANFKPDAVYYDHVDFSSYEDDEDAISLHSDENNFTKPKRLKRGRPRLERDPEELAQLEIRYHRIKPHSPDPDAPIFIKLPYPIPRSWAQIIQPLENEINKDAYECKMIKANLAEFNLTSLGSDFQVCYMDPPFTNSNPAAILGQIHISDFAKFPIPSLVKSGFLFIWVEKEFTSQLFKIVENWGYRYIENIAWIKKNVDNSIAKEPSTFFNTSKTTCYIFRNHGDIKLMHQRNADVIFDFIKPNGGQTQEKPEYIYDIIETLLPEAVNGKMIQLWAKPGYSRSGWTMVVFKYFAHLEVFVNSKLLKLLAFDDQIQEIIGVKAEKYYEMVMEVEKLDDLVNIAVQGQLAKIEVGPSKRDNELVLCCMELLFSPGHSIMDLLKINPSDPDSNLADIDPLLINRPKKKIKFDPFEMDWDEND